MLARTAIVSAVRTPIGRIAKAYANIHPADLLGAAFSAALQRSGLQDAGVIDQGLVGCVQQAGDSSTNIARNAWLSADLPFSVAAATVDTQCGSAQHATNLAAAMIMSGQADVMMCGGVEMLSRGGMDHHRNGGNPYSQQLLGHWDMPGQGVAVERMVKKYGITREASDQWGLRSHLHADAGWNNSVFDDEAVYFERDGKILLDRDEGIRADSSAEKIASLEPAYDPDGIVTAASSSQLSDGAAALLLASEQAIKQHDLEPLAWIRRTAMTGADPNLMLEGPITATRLLLEKENMRITDFDLIEVHEAYAVVVLAWLQQYPEVDPAIVNVHGGAIAMGHPFGASGARQLTHLAQRMKRTGAKRALQVMCCGGGIGTGTILEC